MKKTNKELELANAYKLVKEDLLTKIEKHKKKESFHGALGLGDDVRNAGKQVVKNAFFDEKLNTKSETIAVMVRHSASLGEALYLVEMYQKANAFMDKQMEGLSEMLKKKE